WPRPPAAAGIASPRPASWSSASALTPDERNRSQFATPAVTAAATPTSSAVTTPTCHPDGPMAASRPLPSGPPANAASTASTVPASRPQPNPHSGATSSASTGAARVISSPPNTPARYGTASTITDSAGGAAACTPGGSAASMGNAGIGPSAEPVG